MQKYNGGAVLWPRDNGVQGYTAVLKTPLFVWRLHGSKVYTRKGGSPRQAVALVHQNPGAPEAAGRISGAFTPKRKCAK